jgi:hypothetical protein
MYLSAHEVHRWASYASPLDPGDDDRWVQSAIARISEKWLAPSDRDPKRDGDARRLGAIRAQRWRIRAAQL